MKNYYLLPTKEEALTILEQGRLRNPGPWIAHSRTVADCARKIAVSCNDLDPDKAYVLGLLHDIGRRYGKGDLRHIVKGYLYMKSLGYTDVARICMTHSFPCQTLQDLIGHFDVTADETELVRQLLDCYEYDDYDRLIQVCDSVSMPEGPVNMDTRMDSVAVKYGYYPPGKRQRLYELREYFEDKTGRNLYQVIGAESVYDQK